MRNVSSHGMMLLMDEPPPRGTFVEVRCGSAAIVGRVMWSDAGRCGLRTQKRISVAALALGGPSKAGVAEASAATARVHFAGATAERAATTGRRLQFAATLAVLLVAGLVVARVSHTLLARSSEAIARALS